MRTRAQRILQLPFFEPLVAVMILVSIALMVPEICLPREHPAQEEIERYQLILTGAFALELSLRYAALRRKRRFFREYWGDLLALFPVLRLARFFRLLRLLRLFRLAQVVTRVPLLHRLFLHRSAEYFLGACVLIFCVILGTLGLTHFEHPNSGLVSLISDFWISLFTVTQAEYANSLPRTLGGKLILLCLEVSGLTLFAVLTAMASAILIDKLRDGTVLRRMDLEDLEGHILICGWNSGMEATIRQLQLHPDFRGREFVVVADRKELPELAEIPDRQRVRLVRDDFTRIEVLEKCNVHQASVALIVSDVAQGRTRQDADARTVLAALTIEKLNPAVYTCAELSNAMNESHLRMGNVNEVVITQDLAGHLLAQAAVSPSSWRALHELVQPTRPGQGFTSLALAIEERGREFAELVEARLRREGTLIVGVYTVEGKTLLNPRHYRLREGDVLVTIPPG